MIIVLRGEYERRHIRRELTLLLCPEERIVQGALVTILTGHVVGVFDNYLQVERISLYRNNQGQLQDILLEANFVLYTNV